MASILDALVLWTAERRNSALILVPGEDGIPERVAEHLPVLRARYISPEAVEAELEGWEYFSNPYNYQLIVRTGDSELSPATTALVYHYHGEKKVQCRVGSECKTVEAREYRAATKVATAWAWNSDLSQRKYGYFLVGGMGPRNLWRIQRAEADFANRLVFTILPVAPSNGLPSLDLSSIQTEEIRQQIDQHWREFIEVFSRQLPLKSANAAKDLCEFLLRDVLKRVGAIKDGEGDFGACLKKLLEILNTERRASVPFTLLHFHLMQKIRLMHGGSHAAKVERDGPVSPELGLSIATDLVEIFRAAGIVRIP